MSSLFSRGYPILYLVLEIPDMGSISVSNFNFFRSVIVYFDPLFYHKPEQVLEGD